MLRRISCYLLLFVSCSSLAFSQGFRATIVGRVTDNSGAVIPNAKVTVVNTGTNDKHDATVSNTGDYVVPQLLPGEYTVTVEMAGFSRYLRRVVLETGQQARIDVVLSPGTVSQSVEVEATAALVSTENASIGNVVDQKKIAELPLNGRNYLQLAQLQPNVFAPAQGSTVGFRGGFNVAGNSEVANNYMMDGIDNNDETTNQPLAQPILDAVQEFRVLTGTYSAEYGRQGGGQIIVNTRSGTNDFHGSLYEFHRNSVFDATNYFAPKKPSFKRNQFGGVIGGPILREKTFFFAGYEGQRRGAQEASQATVPLPAFKNGDFSSVKTQLRNPFSTQPCNPSANQLGGCFINNQIPQSMWSKQGAGLLALFPNPTTAGTQIFASAASSPYRGDQFSGRVDHKFSDKDSIFGSYQFYDFTQTYALSNPLCSARDVPGWGCDELQRTMSVPIVWTHVFNPRLVNEARVGYTRFAFFRLQQDRDVDVVQALGIGGLTDAGVTPFNNGAPEIRVTGFSIIGGATNLPQGRHDNTYFWAENMTYIHGSHTMKWGFDMRKFLFNSFFTSFGRGSFRFDGRFTGASGCTGCAVADLLLGMPFQSDRNLGYPYHHARSFTSGYYFQDDWKLNSSLTLNLGLRYELNLPPTEINNKLASFDPNTSTLKVAGGQEAFIDTTTGLLALRPRADVGERLWKTDKTDFAPRVGLAWKPFGSPNTVVRAGFGLFYNYQIIGNGITPLSRNSPFRQRQTSTAPATPTPATLTSLANPFAGNPSIVPPGIDPNFREAYNEQWSLGIQKEIMSNTVLDISYLGSEGHHLPMGININQAFPATGSSAPSLNCRRPFNAVFCANPATARFGFGNITGGFVESVGNASFNSLQVRVERRLTKGLSFVSSYTWSKAIDMGPGISTSSNASATDAQDVRNLGAERGLSDYDVTHRYVLSYVYDLPFGNKRRFETSNRFVSALISDWQMTGIFNVQTGAPFTVFTGSDQSNTGQNLDRPNLIGDWHISNPGPTRWFNTCTLSANGAQSFNCLPGDKPAWQVNAPGTFGNAGRNMLRGPGLNDFDLGFSRMLYVTERKYFQFRGEIFNLANRPNFYAPQASSVTSSAFGQIQRAASQNETGAQRQVQFALKFVF
jgi:hypothetical protein